MERKITDDELADLQRKLTAMSAQNPTSPVLRERLDLLLREAERRAFVKNREPEPLTEDQFIAMARMARTPEEQAQLLARVGDVRSRYSNLIGMLGTGQEDYLRKNAEELFPRQPKETPEQIAAEVAYKVAQKEKAQAEAVAAKARADRLNAQIGRAHV